MSKLFRRHTNVQCFFCNTSIPAPANPRNFRCPSCRCLNRYDAAGEILSDEPAMHDESLNSRSFARRASPNKDRLPTAYGSGPFCHTCQTNQTLLVHLISNYLPPPEHPEYVQRLESLPHYKESLQARYPPVCASCLPAVEDEIHKKDHMARTKALGGWLKDSRGKDEQRRALAARTQARRTGLTFLAWRIRGFLWVSSYVTSLLGNGGAAFGRTTLSHLSFIVPIFPILAFLSIFWAVWDPTYSSFQTARIQGRDIRIRGREKYVVLQIVAWVFRTTTSVLLWLNRDTRTINPLLVLDLAESRTRMYFAFEFVVEFCTLIASCVVLRLQQPPTIRLVDTTTHKQPQSQSRSPTPKPVTRGNTPLLPQPMDADILAPLTLSSKPILTPAPKFGVPSLPTAPTQADDEEMDWTPTSTTESTNASTKRAEETSYWLRPQRFFAPEKPTGLEGLFERTKLVDEDQRPRPHNQAHHPHHSYLQHWRIFITGFVVLSIGVTVALWRRQRSTPDPVA